MSKWAAVYMTLPVNRFWFSRVIQLDPTGSQSLAWMLSTGSTETGFSGKVSRRFNLVSSCLENLLIARTSFNTYMYLKTWITAQPCFQFEPSGHLLYGSRNPPCGPKSWQGTSTANKVDYDWIFDPWRWSMEVFYLFLEAFYNSLFFCFNTLDSNQLSCFPMINAVWLPSLIGVQDKNPPQDQKTLKVNVLLTYSLTMYGWWCVEPHIHIGCNKNSTLSDSAHFLTRSSMSRFSHNSISTLASENRF